MPKPRLFPDPAPATPTAPAHVPAIFLTMLLAMLLAVAISLSTSSPAQAGQETAYRSAVESFKTLNATPRLAKYRDKWLRVLDDFREALNQDPDGPYSARCLYFTGRTWEELSRRSYLNSDRSRAVDAFQRALKRFPSRHSWEDDCLYRIAELQVRMGQTTRARENLARQLRDHPRGDMAAKGKKLLARLGGTKTASQPAPRKAAKISNPAPAIATTATRGAKHTYQRAVNLFKAMRARPKSRTRAEWLKAHAGFQKAYTTDPTGPYAAKSMYFMGFVYDELTRWSGRRDDAQKAADHYERAVRLFPDGHSWADDALYKKALLEYRRLKDEDQAYADLLTIVHGHPKGDMAAKAKDMLRKMDQALVKKSPGTQKTTTPHAPSATPKAAAPKAAAPDRPLPSGVVGLTGIRHRSTDDYTRIVLDLTGEATFTDHKLPPDPKNSKSHRMYIDVDNVRLAPGVDTDLDMGQGFLRSVRAGQYSPSTARVVLDFEKPQKYHVFTLESPFRIVVDVFAQGNGQAETAARRTAAAGKTHKPASSAPKSKPTKATQKVAKDVLAQLGMTVKTILIDPGHGGRDPGAVRYKDKRKRKIDMLEKTVTLRAAKILGRELEKRGYSVIYTRTRDTKVSLEDRAVLGNIKKADMFISLHCNANHTASVSGFETYFLGKANKRKILRLAAYENGVDPVRISDTQKIVMDLVHSFKIEESRALARKVQDKCVRTLRRSYKTVNDHGARGAPFYVLIGAKMPAILVEIGYLTNTTEAQRLRSDNYLARVAKGIADGVDSYTKDLTVSGL